MADLQIQDSTIITALVIIFNYLVVYRRNRFFGNIIFMGSGIMLMSLSTETINRSAGLIILLGGIVSFLYDLSGILSIGKSKNIT